MTDSVSFESLPSLVKSLSNDVLALKNAFEDLIKGLEANSQTKATTEPNASEWLSLDELCNYLPDKPSKHTIYKYVSRLEIPFHKDKKKLRFKKSEISDWLNANGAVQSCSFSDNGTKSVNKLTYFSQTKNTITKTN